MASQAPRSRRPAAAVPVLVLGAYGVAFASAALGLSAPVFDDHPGQLYRLWHVVTHGPAPWAWNPGWWTGYPELQFYPPAFAYLGALLHTASLGVLPVEGAQLGLLWLTYLAPGLTAWLALRRALGSGWPALPGAFVALTLSLWPALTSGVEGGVRVGMAPARLAWALLPLLAAVLMPWSEGTRAFPARATVALVGAVVLMHPTHLPAALALLVLAVVSHAGRARRLLTALLWLGVTALLTAFWTLPLLARLAHTHALAWGTLTLTDLADTVRAHPLVVALALGALGARLTARDGAGRLLARFPESMVVVVALDALVLGRAGVAWLPADRVMDGFWLALALAGGLGAGRLLRALAVVPRAAPAAALGAIAVAIALSLLGRETLALWPRASAWPTYAATERGLRLPALWALSRQAPEGRVLFVRSGVPLVHGLEWWRPHTHVTALTPLHAGRAIVNGTFTHPSPVAALVYRGRLGDGPITTLVEQLDGRTLFGRPLAALDSATFNAYAAGLGVSVVVALEDDAPSLPGLDDNPAFPRRRREPPFIVWIGAPVALARPQAPGRWQAALGERIDGWSSVPVAYYPLWRAAADGAPLPTRRGAHGQLEVLAPDAVRVVDLTYGPGAPEVLGLGLSAAALVVWLLGGWRPRRRRRRAAAPSTA